MVEKRMHWFCTMCDHYKKASSVQAKYVGCGNDNCFSPVAGGWFPSYSGVLRTNGSDNAHLWCFFCGENAVAAVRVGTHYLGICSVHTAHLRTRVHRQGGTVRDVFTKERRDVLACDDAEMRGKQ